MPKATVAESPKGRKMVAEVVAKLEPPTPGVPNVTELVTDPEELANVMDAMDEYVQLSKVMADAELRQKELKAILTGVAIGAGEKAYQSADIKVSVSTQSRSTFNKAAMLEHVTATVLESCYTQGAEFYVTKVEVRKKTL